MVHDTVEIAQVDDAVSVSPWHGTVELLRQGREDCTGGNRRESKRASRGCFGAILATKARDSLRVSSSDRVGLRSLPTHEIPSRGGGAFRAKGAIPRIPVSPDPGKQSLPTCLSGLSRWWRTAGLLSYSPPMSRGSSNRGGQEAKPALA